MKVVVIYRKPRCGAYSIEELFQNITNELGNYVQIISFITGDRNSVIADAIKLRKMNADIYHITGDVNYIAMFLPRKKTIITVHDIGFYLYESHGFKKHLYNWLWFILPIMKINNVTTISEATSQNLIKYCRVKPEKITYIPNCYNNIMKYHPKSFNNNFPTILQIGTAPNKNLPRLIEALELIKCKLTIIGPVDATLKVKLDNHKIFYESYINLTKEEIYQQYLNTDIVSFMSLNEGFGMPIIEAQAVGRVVITSNLLPMSFVAGDGACLVDPFDIEQIRCMISKIIADKEYRENLIANGLNNVKKYTLEKISKDYLNLYNKIYSEEN